MTSTNVSSGAVLRVVGAILLSAGTCASGEVGSYEGNSFPNEVGWDVGQEWCDPRQWTNDGWFLQHVELCPGYDPPGGQQSSFVRSLDQFLGHDAFFIEWRMETDGERSELPWGGPANLVVVNGGSVNYHFSIACDRTEFNRDNSLPIVAADMPSGVAHTQRLELYGYELYIWHIDGRVVDAGVPEGPLLSLTPRTKFRTKSAFLPNTTRWDYIRWGDIPLDGSGDFDSDEDVDRRDFYFFHECLTNARLGINGGPGENAGPGCRFADFDSDSDVDLHDLAAFQNAFTGGE